MIPWHPLAVGIPAVALDAALRAAHVADWGKSSRVAVFGEPEHGVALSALMPCEFDLWVETGQAARAKEVVAGHKGKVKVQAADWSAWSLPAASYDGVLVLAAVAAGLEQVVSSLRPALALDGRLVLLWPVRVGKEAAEGVEAWAQKIASAKLRRPSELLLELEKLGFEPESVESASLEEMASLAAAAQSRSGEGDAAKGYAAWANAWSAESGLSFAVASARRKEPNEKPPPSRTAG